jgi:hypothetical protein
LTADTDPVSKANVPNAMFAPVRGLALCALQIRKAHWNHLVSSAARDPETRSPPQTGASFGMAAPDEPSEPE